MLSAFVIQNRLFEVLDRKGHESIIPNYTPEGWYESDMFSVTKAGYAVEHEIKMSAQDFARDADKDKGAKYRRLEKGDPSGPKFFWYVVPETIVPQIRVPAWAGLMVARPYGRGARLRVVKKAPALHSAKVPGETRVHISGLFYWRFWSLRKRTILGKVAS